MIDINKLKIVPRIFYYQKTTQVAQNILGKCLVRRIEDKLLIGIITETEAYLGLEDQAAHSFIGETKRNKVLFRDAGFTYVHSIHRFHCLDITTEEIGKPTSVLIRAIEPIESIDLMMINRKTNILSNLTNGPGKLCEALDIKRDLNEMDITDLKSEIFILEDELFSPNQIERTSRIGISKAKDLPLRFYIKDNKYISKLR